MANAHRPQHSGKPAGQGGMKAPHSPPNPTTSVAPKSGITEAPASEQKRGIHTGGIGGSGKSF